MKIAGFDWDEGNWPKHPQQKPRYIAVGRSRDGRPMFVAFAVRQRGGERFVRPISARYMHAKEAKRYEESS